MKNLIEHVKNSVKENKIFTKFFLRLSKFDIKYISLHI